MSGFLERFAHRGAIGLRREVLPARAARSSAVILRMFAAALACSMFLMVIHQWAAQIERRRELAIPAQPWPCRYDRGVLEACR